jgi:dTDP-4-amino-4,6-dideoxygalactose transaminase
VNPHQVTREFESAVATYCGSRYAVAVSSCTAALLLCCVYHEVDEVELPKFTYVGVAQSILNAGGRIKFTDEIWRGQYRLRPYPIIDAARRTTSSMYEPGTFMCLSLHISKVIGVDQGGVILHDDPIADRVLRKMRFDGRTEGVHPRDDHFTRGFHCYLSPSVAAQALWKLSTLPKHNADLPNSDYSDLSLQPVFQQPLRTATKAA